MAQPSLFFSLPIELRLLVYEELLLVKPCKGLQILRVCRDVYNEALPVLFKRPLKFRTHDDLYNWIQMVGPDNLELVTSISLNLLSFRYNTLGLGRYPLHSPDMFYGKDLPNLQSALTLLPNVQRFIIYKSVPFLGTRFTYEYYFRFFPWLADRYPELRCLTLFINWIPLDFLLQMRFLRSFRFTGFSTSPPAATLVIFQSLKYLEELEVFGPPPDIHSIPAYSPGHTGPGMKYEQSVTPELLLGIRPLKAFTICEIRDTCKTSGVFFCEKIISALARTHGLSLRSLKISLDFPPSTGSRAALVRLFSLANSSIRRVELGWPCLNVLTLDTLPRSLRSLQVSCDDHFPPDDAAQKLVAQKPVLPELVDVVLRTDWRTRLVGWSSRDISASGGPCGKESMDTAVARLRSIGLDAASGWWHPIMFDDLSDNHDDEQPAQKGSSTSKEPQEFRMGQTANPLFSSRRLIATHPLSDPSKSGTTSYQ